MSRTVFILGAGASKAAGAPLMNDFFDAAEAIRRSGIASVDNGSFDLVFDGLAELTNLNAKATVDPHNLEAVFGAFEMAVMCKRLGNLPSEQIAQLGLAIRRVIVDTLEGSMQFPIQDGEVMAPSPYGDFLALIRKMNQADMGSVSVATLNYDIALDYAVYRAGSSIDYGLPGSRGTFPIMKLHGSLNWTRCAKCGGTVPLDLPALIAGYDLTRSLIRGAQYVRLPVRKRLVQIKHCELPCEAEPLIVPPTWNKAQYRDLVSVWERAAAHLAEAESIIVIGYSLPPTDEFFRYLYAIGTSGRTRLKRFWLIDPDRSAVYKRFERLLGPVVRDSRIFRHFENSFSDGIQNLLTALLGPGARLDRE